MMQLAPSLLNHLALGYYVSFAPSHDQTTFQIKVSKIVDGTCYSELTDKISIGHFTNMAQSQRSWDGVDGELYRIILQAVGRVANNLPRKSYCSTCGKEL